MVDVQNDFLPGGALAVPRWRRGHRADQSADRDLPALHPDPGLAPAGPLVLRVEPFGPSSPSKRSNWPTARNPLAGPLRARDTRGAEIARELDVSRAATDHPQGLPTTRSTAIRDFVEADRRTADRSCGLSATSAASPDLLRRPRDGFLRRLDRPRCKGSRLRDLRHRGCLPRDRFGRARSRAPSRTSTAPASD